MLSLFETSIRSVPEMAANLGEPSVTSNSAGSWLTKTAGTAAFELSDWFFRILSQFGSSGSLARSLGNDLAAAHGPATGSGAVSHWSPFRR